MPWYLADEMLKVLLGAFGIASAFWYFRSRKLYLENQVQTKKILTDQKIISNDNKTIDLIFKNSADGILILDNQQRILSFSPGMEKITGYSKKEVLGRTAQQILKFRGDHENSLLPDVVFISRGVKKNPIVRNSLVTKSGREIDVEASYALIKDDGVNNYKGLAIIRDVTFEQEMIKRDKDFIAITSHQLNTPLSIIRGYISLLRNGKAGKVDAKQKTYLDEIYGATKKMIDLTNNLLSISRIEAEKIKIEREDMNLGQFFVRLQESLHGLATDKGVELKFEAPPTNLVIYVDQEKLYQAFFNIIFNAIKYTAKGSVSINFKNEKDQITFQIIDTGIGIPTEDIDHVGEKFYRSQNAIDTHSQGTGLGLFIAKTIIEKHNGRLNIDSTIDSGTTMSFSIPLITKE